VGQQQAKLYADCLEQMYGQRPIILYTNGYTTWMWDDTRYPPRQVAGFYKKDELARLIRRRTQRQTLDVAQVKDAIVERYYQKRAIGSIFSQFAKAVCKVLLVMATLLLRWKPCRNKIGDVFEVGCRSPILGRHA
jgi:type I restriction enzyme, R subunit